MTSYTFTPEQIDGFEVNCCYQGKIQCQKDDELYKALWLTHQTFNQKVADVCRHIFKVLNDKSNPEFAQLTRWAIRNISPAGHCSTHFANPFTLESSRANPTHTAYNKQSEMKELFLLCKERGDRWYSRKDVFNVLTEGRSGGSGLVAEVNQAAIERISGYLSLMDNWRNGKYIPLDQLDEEAFIKKITKFLKDYRELIEALWQKEIDDNETTKDTKVYETLLYGKEKERNALLQEMYRHRLLYGWIIDELGSLYQNYSNEALGKKNWLKQKLYFDSTNREFKEQYEKMLSFYRKQFPDHSSEQALYPSRRWFRDPNFLRMLNEHGQEIWDNFQSPLQDPGFEQEWASIHEKNEKLPEMPWDSRQGRELLVHALEKLNNSNLFNKTNGWFSLFERYIKLQKFTRPPQFRYPNVEDHPDWINFSESGCFQYRNPKVGKAQMEITINLIDPSTTNTWKTYTLKISLDERLKALGDRQTIQVPKGKWIKTLDNQRLFEWDTDEHNNHLYKEEEFYPWVDSDGVIQWIQIHGGNLLHKKENGAFYLNFRYTYKTPKKHKLRDETQIEYSYKPGTRLLGVDQGQKADAVVTILELTEWGELKPVKFKPFQFKKHKGLKARKKGQLPGTVFYQWIKLPGGIGFRAVAHAERLRSQRIKRVKQEESKYFKKREEDGKPLPADRKTQGRFLVKGHVFCKSLKNYIEHCRDLHYKTVAGVLVKIAKENQCQGIVIENLKSYKTTLKQERTENKRLMLWSMQKKLDFLEMLCDSGQLNFIDRSAAYTSQTCNHCESWGVRFNFPTKKEWAKYKHYGVIPSNEDEQIYPVISLGGDWFLCSNERCSGKKEPDNLEMRYMIQADANAAKNLLKRAFRKNGWGAKIASKEDRKRIQNDLQEWLKTKYTKRPAQGQMVIVHT